MTENNNKQKHKKQHTDKRATAKKQHRERNVKKGREEIERCGLMITKKKSTKKKIRKKSKVVRKNQ